MMPATDTAADDASVAATKTIIFSLEGFIPEVRASSSPSASTFKRHRIRKRIITPAKIGMYDELSNFQLALCRLPIVQWTIDCNLNGSDKNCTTVSNAVKIPVTITPERMRETIDKFLCFMAAM